MSRIDVIFTLATFVLVLMAIIGLFKHNGTAKKRFIWAGILILLIILPDNFLEDNIRGTLGLVIIVTLFLLTMAFIGLFKRDGTAKHRFQGAGICFIIVVLGVILIESTESRTVTEEVGTETIDSSLNKEKAEVFKEKGLTYFNNQEYEKTIEALNKAVSLGQEKDAELYYYLAMSYSNLKNDNSFRTSMAMSLELDPILSDPLVTPNEFEAIMNGFLNSWKGAYEVDMNSPDTDFHLDDENHEELEKRGMMLTYLKVVIWLAHTKTIPSAFTNAVDKFLSGTSNSSFWEGAFKQNSLELVKQNDKYTIINTLNNQQTNESEYNIFYVPNHFTPVFSFFDKRDVSLAGAERIVADITVPLGLSKGELENNLKAATEIIYNEYSQPNAITIFAYREDDAMKQTYSAARSVFAPYGDWEKANEKVPLNNYEMNIDFSETYFNPKQGNKKGSIVEFVGDVSIHSKSWNSEDIILSVSQPTDALILEVKNYPMGNLEFIRYKVEIDYAGKDYIGWIHDYDVIR